MNYLLSALKGGKLVYTFFNNIFDNIVSTNKIEGVTVSVSRNFDLLSEIATGKEVKIGLLEYR